MKKEEWIGIDSSKSISLFEYGLLICKNWQCEHPDEWFCLVGIKKDPDGVSYSKFDYGYIRESEVLSESWIDWKALFSFGEFHSQEEWDNEPFINKLYCLFSYYGYQNFGFGTNWEFTIKPGELASYMLNMKGQDEKNVIKS